MTLDLARSSETAAAAVMQFARAKSSSALLLASACSGSSSLSTYSSGKRKLFLARSQNIFTKPIIPCSASALVLIVILVVLCNLTPPVHSSPLPSSSAWSLPTLNYLFKDTKTQSNQYKKEGSNGQGGIGRSHHSHQPNAKMVIDNNLPSNSLNGENVVVDSEQGNKVSSTGRLISAHDIRLTDNWGWVRRGASDPQTTTEQRRKQNIRHSKSKHKQRHHFTSASAASSLGGVAPSSSGSSGGGRSRKRDKTDNLLCPFDEIRGPDGKCRKAPRFSLYRVGRK